MADNLQKLKIRALKIASDDPDFPGPAGVCEVTFNSQITPWVSHAVVCRVLGDLLDANSLGITNFFKGAKYKIKADDDIDA